MLLPPSLLKMFFLLLFAGQWRGQDTVRTRARGCCRRHSSCPCGVPCEASLAARHVAMTMYQLTLRQSRARSLLFEWAAQALRVVLVCRRFTDCAHTSTHIAVAVPEHVDGHGREGSCGACAQEGKFGQAQALTAAAEDEARRAAAHAAAASQGARAAEEAGAVAAAKREEQRRLEAQAAEAAEKVNSHG